VTSKQVNLNIGLKGGEKSQEGQGEKELDDLEKMPLKRDDQATKTSQKNAEYAKKKSTCQRALKKAIARIPSPQCDDGRGGEGE